MRQHTWMAAGALALALAACGKSEPDPYLASVPDAAGLTMEVQGGAVEGLALTVDGADSAATLATTPTTNDDLTVAREKVRMVNEGVRKIFGEVAAVAAQNGVPLPGEVKRYGPAERCVVPGATAGTCADGGTATLQLFVRRAAIGKAYAFELQAQVGADWRDVAAGWMIRGEVDGRGVGRIALDLENLRAAATAYPGQGYLLGGFANGRVRKALGYALVGFTPDPAQWPAATVAFRAFKNAVGTTRVRFAEIADLYQPGGTASDTELGFGRVAWNPALGGRAFMFVRNYVDGTGTAHGDVPVLAGSPPVEQYFFGRSCYAPAAPSAPKFKEWFLCPRGTGPAACVLAQGGVGTQVAGAAGETWASSCALATEPPELAPPTGAPGGDPSDASTPEPGESAPGMSDLAPPTPPADPTDVAPPAA